MKMDNVTLLKQFCSAPSESRVKIDSVQALWGGISRTTVWRYIKTGMIPQPIKLGGRTCTWRVGDLREALKKMGGQK